MRLNKIENHKTVLEFENNFYIKYIIFKMANNFVSIIYVAFAKQGHYGCIESTNNMVSRWNTCVSELSYQVLIMFLFSFFENGMYLLFNLLRERPGSDTYIEKIKKLWTKGKEVDNTWIIRLKVQVENKKPSFYLKDLNVKTSYNIANKMVLFAY